MPIIHPIEPMPYADAIAYVEKFFFDHALTDEFRALCGAKATIYDYFDRDPDKLAARPWVGVRVSEVAFSYSQPDRAGGASYMQADQPWGVAFCGQVERCILALVEGWNQHEHESESTWDYDPELFGEGDEEFDRLQALIDAAAAVPASA